MIAKWYKEQPVNRNFLSPIGFKLNLELFDGVDFFCQKANLPGISMPFIEVPTRFRNFPIAPGGGVTYDDFDVTFLIDEDLKNYNSILSWIKKNGGANEHSTNEIEYSNGQLLIATSNFNPNFFVDYEKLFPISLTPITFDATVSDIEYFAATAQFKYTNFTLRDKNFKIL